jgi:hypothetical protein
MALSREDILSFKDYEVRTVKAFGGSVRIKSLSVSESLKMSAMLKDDIAKAMCTAVSFACVDKDDKPLFTLDDVEALSKKSAKSVVKIFNEVVAMNTIDAERVEDAKKN